MAAKIVVCVQQSSNVKTSAMKDGDYIEQYLQGHRFPWHNPAGHDLRSHHPLSDRTHHHHIFHESNITEQQREKFLYHMP